MKAPMKAPNLNLTREMKLVLILLLMVALIGGWFVLTNRSTPEPVAVTPAAQPDAAQPASGSTGTPAQTGDTGTGTPTATTPLATGGQIEVATLPPFPVPDTAASGAAVTPAPGGINPDQALLTLGTSNPFRPLQVVPAQGQPIAQATGSGAAPAGTQATGPITVPAETTPVASVPSGTAPVQVTPVPETRETAAANPVGGAVPITRLPGTGSVSSNVTPISSGALPTVTIPGAGPSTNTVTRPATGSSAASRPTTTTSPVTSTATTPAAPPAPIVPPIAGVTAPRETGASPVGNAAPTPAQSGGASAGTAQTGGAAAGSAVPAASTPQVITQLGQGGAPAASTPAAGNALDRVLSDRGVNLDGAVLGPVNTAVFRTSSGFVVVSVGQTLPDTDVVLREVTATTATLALGNNVKTLQLEQR